MRLQHDFNERKEVNYNEIFSDDFINKIKSHSNWIDTLKKYPTSELAYLYSMTKDKFNYIEESIIFKNVIF